MAMHWTRVLETAPWAGRANAFCCSFGGLLWMYGGTDTGDIVTELVEIFPGFWGEQVVYSPRATMDDIWSSPDGVTWTFRGNLPFPLTYDEYRFPNSRSVGAVFDDQIVLFTFQPISAETISTRCMVSDDGLNFSLAYSTSVSVQNYPRAANGLGAELGGQLYAFSDVVEAQLKRSSGLSTWTTVTTPQSFAGIPMLFSLGSALYCMTSGAGTIRRSLDNGATWSAPAGPLITPARSLSALCQVGADLYVHGGLNVAINALQDLWKGVGMEAFEIVEEAFHGAPSIGPRVGHALVHHDGAFFLFGGSSDVDFIDGLRWDISPLPRDVWRGEEINGSGAGGNGGIVPVLERSTLFPDATARASHARILRSYRNQAQAEQFHNIMKGAT